MHITQSWEKRKWNVNKVSGDCQGEESGQYLQMLQKDVDEET